MVKVGSGLLVVALVLWFTGYIGLIFQSFVLWFITGMFAFIGSVILFIGVIGERLEEKEEEKKNDYSEY